MKRKSIAISLPYGMSARNVLRSGLTEKLLSEAELLVFTPLYKDPAFLKEFSRPGIHFFDLKRAGPWERRWAVLLNCLETNQWYRHSDHPTFRIIDETIRAGKADDILKNYSYYFTWWVRTLSEIPGMAGTIRKLLLRRWGRQSYYQEIFSRFEPELVFFTHPYAPEERTLSGFVANKPVRKVALIHSWDNPTTKPKMLFTYDSLVVWSKILQDQLVRLYRFSKENIFIGGGLQFDSYMKREDLKPRNDYLSRFKIDPAKKVITYACGNPTFVPEQERIVETILQASRNGRFRCPVHLIVRAHPGVVIPGLEKFRNQSDVTLDFPSIAYVALPLKSGWQNGSSGTEHFVNLLAHSDVFINCFSTTTIDAAIFDRPIINIAYDPVPTDSYYASCVKHYDLEHYRPIVDSGGIRLARNPEELITAINDYLVDPARDAEGRRRIVTEQCTFTDAQSAERIANYILSQYPADLSPSTPPLLS